MPFWWTSARRLLRELLRDPWSPVVWIVVPLMVSGAVSIVSGGAEGPQPVAHLLLSDRDGSLVSRLFTGAFAQDQLADMIQSEPVALNEGMARMERGEASALLVIPPAFGQAVIRNEPTEVSLISNPSQRILPGLVRETAMVLVDGVFYAHQLFGEEIRAIVDLVENPGNSSGPADADVAAIAVAINRAATALGRQLSDPAIRLEIAPPVQQEHAPVSFGLLFLPGIMVWSLFFAAQTLSGRLWLEREQGTLRRLATTSRSLLSLTLGYALAAATVSALVAALMALWGLLYHGVGMERWAWTVVWLTLSGVCLYALMVLVQLTATSQRAGYVATSVIMFPLLMLGGSFFPAELLGGMARSEAQVISLGVSTTMIMSALGGCMWPIELSPDWMQNLQKALPTGRTMSALHQLVSFQQGAAAGAWQLAALLTAAATVIPLAARRFRYT